MVRAGKGKAGDVLGKGNESLLVAAVSVVYVDDALVCLSGKDVGCADG